MAPPNEVVPRSLFQAFDDFGLIPLLDTEELARVLLFVARWQGTPAGFTLSHVLGDLNGPIPRHGAELPKAAKRAVGEAWHWLALNSLIMPAEGINGNNGYMVFTRRGEAIVNGTQSFQSFRAAAGFPRELIHPAIADRVWPALARDDLDVAVFIAFRAVEEAVREKGGYGAGAGDVGVNLMRKAFDASEGPLTDLSQPKAEREALCHLFAGAIGSYKNPHSHRTVSNLEAREAREMVLLASHLLAIVDSRPFR